MVQLTQRQFERYRQLVHKWTGVTIAESRRSMLASRLASRLRALAMDDLNAYYDFVHSDTVERALFIDRVTTHETYFFRTASVWDYIENTFLPDWVQHYPGRECRVWSAASSSGEEAYSVAMLMRELQLANPSFRFSVHGSDISEESVKKCRAGIYRGRSIERLRQSRPALLERYLKSAGDQYSIVDSLRPFVTFTPHNLFKATDNIATFDLILCRNVLIYFNREDQRQVLSHLARAASPQGVLIIGESEHLPPEDSDFEHVNGLAYRKASVSREPASDGAARPLERIA